MSQRRWTETNREVIKMNKKLKLVILGIVAGVLVLHLVGALTAIVLLFSGLAGAWAVIGLLVDIPTVRESARKMLNWIERRLETHERR